MIEVAALRSKTLAYKMDDGGKHKKAKETKEAVIKITEIAFFKEKTIFKKQQRFKSYYHDMYTQEINKVALSSNDNNRLQIFDRVTTFPHWTTAFKVCEDEILNVHETKQTLKKLNKKCKNELYVTCTILQEKLKSMWNLAWKKCKV